MNIEHLWKAFHKELKGFILNTTRNAADADDILQDVFVKVIKNKEKVLASENIRYYLFAMVRNGVNDHFRNRRYMEAETEPYELSEAQDASLNETIAACCIRPFIEQLPVKYKEALLMAELEQISQKEVAEKLQISYSGAKSRVQRGREKLKEMILDCCALSVDTYGNLNQDDGKDCGCS